MHSRNFRGNIKPEPQSLLAGPRFTPEERQE